MIARLSDQVDDLFAPINNASKWLIVKSWFLLVCLFMFNCVMVPVSAYIYIYI